MARFKKRQIAMTLAATAPAAVAILNFGPFNERDFMLGLSVFWSPSAALAATDFVVVRHGWFTRPPQTQAEFEAGADLLTPADTAISASSLAVLLPVGSMPDSRTPYFAVQVTNSSAAATIAGSLWIWVESQSRRDPPNVPGRP